MMKDVLFSVLSLHCVAASLFFQTNLMKVRGKFKVRDTTCFTVESKLECAVACCTGGKCRGFFYAKARLCQCEQNVTESRTTSEDGAFELWTSTETVQETTTTTTTTAAASTNQNETHYLICSPKNLYWYQYGKSGYIATKSFDTGIYTYATDYDQSTNTLYFKSPNIIGIGYFSISIGKIGPTNVMLKGHHVQHFKVDVDKHVVIWATFTVTKSATLKGTNIKTIYIGTTIKLINIDKLNSQAYILDTNGELYVTTYNGGKPRLIVPFYVSWAFYSQGDKILYIRPRYQSVVEQKEQTTEYKILHQLGKGDYFIIHRRIIYTRPKNRLGLSAITLDGRKLPGIASDTTYDVSIIFL